MASADTIVEFEVKLPEPKVTKFDREKMAFRRLFGELLKTYPGKYVAIHDERVIAVADDRITAANQAYDKVGYVALYIGKASDEPEWPVRIPSFRVIREDAK